MKLSHSDTADALKLAIEGRIQALTNVHALLVKSRWIGAELSSIAAQELAPISEGTRRVRELTGRRCCYRRILLRRLQ